MVSRHCVGGARVQAALWLAALSLAALAPGRAAAQAGAAPELTAQQVRESIARGVAFLKKEQHPTRGNWPEFPGQPGGVTALCTLALLNAGVEPSDPHVARALNYLRSIDLPKATYATSLQTMVFCAAEPERDRLLITRNANWLANIQITDGPMKGSWKYSDQDGQGDNSNAQFALLALHEAERAGVKVSDQVWRLALRYWLDCQNKNEGYWGYFAGQPAKGSMTCAGISSVIIASDRLYAGDADVQGGQVLCCGSQEDFDALEKAFGWLDRHFSVTTNPSVLVGRGDAGRMWLLYYLYGLERVGRLSGRRFIGGHDWYRAGAAVLVRGQDDLAGYWKGAGHAESDPRIATALALLFLSKGRWPVVIGHVKHGDNQDWNRHRSAVQNLTQYVETRWQKNLTWQTIDIAAADANELLQTPVLFLSGRDSLRLSAEQKNQLKKYLDQGGFLFAEACCDGQGFDRDFRALMKELFPDSQLRLLPPEHPVWRAEETVDPQHLRPLYGIDACCRTAVVYCPENLACYWELNHRDIANRYPAPVVASIRAANAIGANVVAYATGRELKEKLDTPRVVERERGPDAAARATLHAAKLSHAGGADDAPNALANILELLGRHTGLPASTERLLLPADDPQLMEHPLLFMHGRRAFRLSPAERQALAEYFDRGGFLLADAICGSPEFARSFRSEIAAIFPGRQLERIATDHPLFSTAYRGYEIREATIRDPQAVGAGEALEARLTKISPLLEGLEIDGRLVVVFSPYDLSCAMENATSLDCHGYLKPDAARLAINVLLYALQE